MGRLADILDNTGRTSWIYGLGLSGGMVLHECRVLTTWWPGRHSVWPSLRGFATLVPGSGSSHVALVLPICGLGGSGVTLVVWVEGLGNDSGHASWYREAGGCGPQGAGIGIGMAKDWGSCCLVCIVDSSSC